MKRRGFIAATAAATAGCLGSGTDGNETSTTDVDAGGSVNWDINKTVSGGYVKVHRFVLGELDAGDAVEFHVTVERGQSAVASVENRDNGNIAYEQRVYRDERIDSFDENEHVESPHEERVEVSEYGEYELVVITPSDNEVTVRVRSERAS